MGFIPATRYVIVLIISCTCITCNSTNKTTSHSDRFQQVCTQLIESKSDNELVFLGKTHSKLKKEARKDARKKLSDFFEGTFIQESGDMFFPNTFTGYVDPPGDYKSKLRTKLGTIRDDWITISRRMIRKQKANNNFRHQQKVTRSSNSFVIYDMLYVSKDWILKHWVESLSNAIGDEFVIKLRSSKNFADFKKMEITHQSPCNNL